MNQQMVEEYISKLPYSEVFTDLPQAVKDKIVFGSHEMLKRRYEEAQISDEIVALQSLFVAEGEEEEFAKFKRQGVSSISLSGLSLSVSGSTVSPEVIAVLGEPGEKAGIVSNDVFFGRLM